MEPARKRPMRQAVEIKPAGEPREYVDNGYAVTFVPLSIKRRQTRKLLIPPAGSGIPQNGMHDLPLIKTLGKAFYWQSLIDRGEEADAGTIAQRYKLDKGWVNEVLRMTLLAPDIIEAILDGRQPRYLNLHTLRGRLATIPSDWAEQRQLLGFN